MTIFRVAPQVFEKLPGACFGVVAAKGLDNSAECQEISRLLEEETAFAKERLAEVNLKEYPAIVPYRNAFTALGFNPNKFMCSVEALCKRVMKGAALPTVNPVVDLGNALSLRHILPMGAHDMGKLGSGDLEVRFSTEEDSFLPFGETETEHPGAGELVYASGHTIKTRRWIWRQSEDGKIDASSSDIIFPIDGFTNDNLAAVTTAQQELAALLREYFGCEVSCGLVNQDNMNFAL